MVILGMHGVTMLIRDVQPAFLQGAAQDGLIFSAVEKRTTDLVLLPPLRSTIYLSCGEIVYCFCEASDNLGDSETLKESGTSTVSCSNFEFITEPLV
jgi:hypothetical protein